MATVLWVLTFAVILGIAAGAVRVVADRLATEARVAVYDLPEAVEFVADRLPPDVAARLTYDDVRVVLEERLALLEALGAAVPDGADLAPDGAAILVVEDDTLAAVLGRLEDRALELADEDVALVLALEADYLRAIGALGGEAPPQGPD